VIRFTAVALFGLMLMGTAHSPAGPSPVSQAFGDRLARTSARVTSASARHLLAPGQEELLRAQIDMAKRANDAHAANASAMIDVIDRQMAQIDHVLARANNGQAIVVHVGEDVTVAMHDPYFYDVQNSNPAALALHRGVMWSRGVQGTFAAKTPATVTLTLTPRMNTKPVPPQGMQEPVVFTVVILPPE
jgi:hypothetical protein